MSYFVTIPLSSLLSHRTKVAISLPELGRITNYFSVKNRPGCVPALQKSIPAQLYVKYNVRCDLKTSDPNGHIVEMKFDLSKVHPGSNAKDIDVKLRCECPAWLYWGAQWNSAQKDGLLGDPRPKFQAPKERLDLRGNFYICKHVKSVAERILPSVQHNINNIVRKREVEEYKQQHPTKAPSRLLTRRKKQREIPEEPVQQTQTAPEPKPAPSAPAETVQRTQTVKEHRNWLDKLKGVFHRLKNKGRKLKERLTHPLFKKK